MLLYQKKHQIDQVSYNPQKFNPQPEYFFNCSDCFAEPNHHKNFNWQIGEDKCKENFSLDLQKYRNQQKQEIIC